MKRWWNHFFVTTLAAGLTWASIAWGQQQMPKPPMPQIPTTPAAPTTPAPAATPAAATSAVGAKVNINSADEAELISVKGIGKAKAKAIIEYRQKNGPFKAIDDLTKVKGIKEKTLKKFRDQLTV